MKIIVKLRPTNVWPFFFNIMKNFFLLILIFFVSNNILSQVSRSIEAESSVVTNHFVTVNGTRIPYSATAGTLPVWSEDDNAVATLFYTYYKRSDVKLSLIHI